MEMKLRSTLIVLLCTSTQWTAYASPAPYYVVTGEYKSLMQVGDRVEAAYEKLYPDGHVERHEAFGDPQKGMEYRDFQIDPDGNILALDSPQPFGRIEDNPHRGHKISKWRDDVRPRDMFDEPKTSKSSIKSFFNNLFNW